jgi:hypothetical protein
LCSSLQLLRSSQELFALIVSDGAFLLKTGDGLVDCGESFSSRHDCCWIEVGGVGCKREEEERGREMVNILAVAARRDGSRAEVITTTNSCSDIII